MKKRTYSRISTSKTAAYGTTIVASNNTDDVVAPYETLVSPPRVTNPNANRRRTLVRVFNVDDTRRDGEKDLNDCIIFTLIRSGASSSSSAIDNLVSLVRRSCKRVCGVGFKNTNAGVVMCSKVVGLLVGFVIEGSKNAEHFFSGLKAMSVIAELLTTEIKVDEMWESIRLSTRRLHFGEANEGDNVLLQGVEWSEGIITQTTIKKKDNELVVRLYA